MTFAAVTRVIRHFKALDISGIISKYGSLLLIQVLSRSDQDEWLLVSAPPILKASVCTYGIMQLCLYTCVSSVCLLSRLEASRPSCDPLSPLLISNTLSSRPPCLCCVSAPPLRLIASSRLDTPALCHTAADKIQPTALQVQPDFHVLFCFSHAISQEIWCI